ncbi:tRNA (adenosine(37)-N6)-dimethylallyltransferase MiaA [Candidatus Kaiserbacteria bacterium]|nr:tRNA (adenosine(37)-N6)-dimethylallyltransferase MiaA [Candidatus Kaiserbacteria bacterium]
MTSKQKILIIVGPTASGKTALAIELAKKLDGEVISADSRQVYRGLDIGTGKVTKREMEGIPHHLLDVASPKQVFTADDFVTRADRAIADISKRGKLPIIAGGTGFYIDALVGRITLPDVPPNPVLRKKLHPKTIEQLYALLKKKDPARAASMDTPSERNNKVRLIRAFEIAEALGQNPPPTVQGQKYDALWIGINPSLKVLEQKISKRLAQRLKIGMIAEAKRLHAGGLSYKRMEALGLEYRSLARFLQAKIDRAEMETELGRDIRRYAKHQLSYWKRNADIKWIKPSQMKTILRHIRGWMDQG